MEIGIFFLGFAVGLAVGWFTFVGNEGKWRKSK